MVYSNDNLIIRAINGGYRNSTHGLLLCCTQSPMVPHMLKAKIGSNYSRSYLIW